MKLCEWKKVSIGSNKGGEEIRSTDFNEGGRKEGLKVPDKIRTWEGKETG